MGYNEAVSGSGSAFTKKGTRLYEREEFVIINQAGSAVEALYCRPDAAIAGAYLPPKALGCAADPGPPA